MKGEATEKIPGGKLLRIKTEFDDKITSIEITGDFFAHPEESIEKIQNLICNNPKKINEKGLIKKIKDLIKTKDYKLIGIDAESIVRVLQKSLKGDSK